MQKAKEDGLKKRCLKAVKERWLRGSMAERTDGWFRGAMA